MSGSAGADAINVNVAGLTASVLGAGGDDTVTLTGNGFGLASPFAIDGGGREQHP